MARPGGASFGSTTGAGLLQARQEAGRADLGEQLHRRHVERHLQGLAGRHGALEGEVEILGPVGAVASRPVVDQGLGMGDPVLEGEGVDEGLQGRTRRAQRLGHVDRARAPGIHVVGAADARPDLAGRVVDDEDRNGEMRIEPRQPFSRERLERLLQARVDGEAVSVSVGRSARASSARWAASMGKGRRSVGTRSCFAAAASGAVRSPAAAARSSTRSRARRAASGLRSGRRASGDCGRATRSAAWAAERRFGSRPK